MECGKIVNFSVCKTLLCLKVGVRGVSELNYSLRTLGTVLTVSEIESTGKLSETFGCIFVLHTINSFIHGASGMCLKIGRVGTRNDTGWARLNRVLVINRHSRLLVCHGRIESILGLQRS